MGQSQKKGWCVRGGTAHDAVAAVGHAGELGVSSEHTLFTYTYRSRVNRVSRKVTSDYKTIWENLYPVCFAYGRGG